MHKFLRAIGFRNMQNKDQLKEVLKDVVANSSDRFYAQLDDSIKVGVMSKTISPSLGISVCGDVDEKANFLYEYYFPYLKSNIKSIQEHISIERHASQVSFAGVCEDMNLGVILIFYLQNFPEYFDAVKEGSLPKTYISLTGLSIHGTIILPIQKSNYQRREEKIFAEKRKTLMQDARNGVESAIESLSMQDMGIYNTICKKILESDIYSLVDTTFIPCGVESDHYSVLGEILQIKKETNMYTNDQIYILTIECNNIIIDIAINSEDLMGEPEVGRRFKGDIWLQGRVCTTN